MSDFLTVEATAQYRNSPEDVQSRFPTFMAILVSKSHVKALSEDSIYKPLMFSNVTLDTVSWIILTYYPLAWWFVTVGLDIDPFDVVERLH